MCRIKRGTGSGRFGIALALLAAGLFAAVPALGQAADEDPLPPLPPIDPNEEPPTDWEAWREVPKLLGVSQADLTTGYSFTSDITRDTRSGQAHTTVFMELTRLSPEESGTSRSFQWRVTSANGFGGMMSSYSKYGTGAGYWLGGEGTVQGTYSGPMSLPVPPLSFDPADGVGGFSTLGGTAGPKTAQWAGSVTELDSVGGGVRVRTFDEVDPWNEVLEASWIDFTAPKAAVPFTGYFALDQTTDQGRGSLRRRASVQFWPDWEDVEVRVEIEDPTSSTNSPSYSDWRPEGNLEAADQGGPRPLRLKATLRPKAESPTPEQLAALPEVRRFRFELSDTSREPGVCMNWPSPPGTNAPPPDPDYDLRFIATIPQAMELSPKKTKAGVIPLPGEDPNLPSAWVLLECFDFGAHANVQVYADLVDGRVIVGHRKVGEEKRYLIPIPDRPPGSLVARKWRDDHKVTGADSDDHDDQPEGDGQKGDGLSVYEEYRGFRVNGAHVSPDPRIKNLLVHSRNVTLTAAACRSVESITVEGGKKGLKIYDELLPEEWHASRIINLNRSRSSPRSSDEPQHGILVETKPGASADDEAVYSYAVRIDPAIPRRPKNYSSVLVHPADLNVKTVAHEITHTIGLNHHGNLDYNAYWIVTNVAGPNGTTARRFFEQVLSVNVASGALTPSGKPFPIYVFEEGSSQQKLPDQSPDVPIPNPTSEFIARSGGQHSGNVTCYMLYDAATAYMPAGRLQVRIIPNPANDVPEVPRNSALCRSCRGTGPNPRRHGHATIGNCLAQLCVRDSAPERPPATGQCPTNAAAPSLHGVEEHRPFLSTHRPAAFPQAAVPPQASDGVLVFETTRPGNPPQATRGWPLHFVWHSIEPGAVEPVLSVSGVDGASLAVNAVEPGHWWISPEQSRNLPAGPALVRVGPKSLTLRLVDAPVDPPTPEQDRARRLAFTAYYLASGQPLAARREAEEWRAASPQAPAPRALLGDALAAQGLLAEALEAYQAAFARMKWDDRPPEALFQRYRKVRRAAFALLPEAPADFFDGPPEPVTLEEQDRVYGQDANGQWAASATASSEYRPSGDYSASRATGAPDVTRYGDNLKAWASRLADSGPEWLELTFSNAVVATAVRVRQVFNPGAITKIEVFDAAGASTTVFSGVDTNVYPANQIAWFVAKFPRTAQPVQRVRITLDSARVKGWNEIDTVQLVAAPALPPSAPTLDYAYQAATGTLEIRSWPAGFVLQRATRLAPADWQTHAVQPPVSLPVGGDPAFFRLAEAP